MSLGQDDFLRTIKVRAGRAFGVVGATGYLRLHGHFWSYDEIQARLALRKDWGVDEGLIPFFGDWHEVICLSVSDGRVIYLGDDRRVLSIWPDIEAFLASLSDEIPQGKESDAGRLVHSEISPELAARVRELLQAKKS